jgi:hypothetical protein
MKRNKMFDLNTIDAWEAALRGLQSKMTVMGIDYTFSTRESWVRFCKDRWRIVVSDSFWSEDEGELDKLVVLLAHEIGHFYRGHFYVAKKHPKPKPKRDKEGNLVPPEKRLLYRERHITPAKKREREAWVWGKRYLKGYFSELPPIVEKLEKNHMKSL